jgi:hypothetical protein
MKRTVIAAGLVVILVFVSSQLVAGYDKRAVQKAMQKNGALFGELTQAAQNGDYFTAAEKLMGIARSIKGLDVITPNKGSKTEWDQIHNDLINAAFKGIGACGEEDSEQLNKYIGEIGAFIKEGHGIFR